MNISVNLRRVAIRGVPISLMFSACAVLQSGAVDVPDNNYSSCSQIPLLKDRSACQRHLQEYTTRITIIPANSQNPVLLIDQTNTLYIFESLDSNNYQAVYVLPDQFRAPDNIAMAGNDPQVWPIIMGQSETLPLDRKFALMSAVNPDSHYYFADLSFHTGRPGGVSLSHFSGSGSAEGDGSGKGDGSAEGDPDKRSVLAEESPRNSLDFMGAGHVTLKNVKVRHDTIYEEDINSLVHLGCTSQQRYPKYTITNSIFELPAAFNNLVKYEKSVFFIECHEEHAGITLTLQNTTSILYPVTYGVGPHATKHYAEVMDVRLFPADKLLRFTGSTCNSVVDPRGNDISEAHIGSIRSTNVWLTGLPLATGGIGFKCHSQAWGWAHSVLPEEPGESPSGHYISRFAPLSYWNSQGEDLTCPHICTVSSSMTVTPPSSTDTEPSEESTLPSRQPTQASTNSTSIPEKHGSGQGDRVSSDALKVVLPVVAGGLILDQIVTHLWYYHSGSIRHPQARRVNKVLATALGLGLPLVQQLIAKKMRAQKIEGILLEGFDD